MRERLARQLEAESQRRPAGPLELGEHAPRSPRDRRRPARPESSWPPRAPARPADVDLLDQRVEGDVGLRRRLHERIQLTTTRSMRPMPCRPQRRQVVGPVAARQDAAVDRRVQRLDAAVHHLGKAGHVGDAGDREPGLLERRAVPPVDTSSKPRARGPARRSTRPVLSETLSRALGMRWSDELTDQ